MAVGDAHVFPGFLTQVLIQISFQSHRLLFSHASAEVRGENTPERHFASTGSRPHNHQVISPTHSPLSHPHGASVDTITVTVSTGVFSPLASAEEACERKSRWLWKDSGVSAGMRKQGNTRASPTAINMTLVVKVALNPHNNNNNNNNFTPKS